MKVNLVEKFSFKLREVLENYDYNNVILFVDCNNGIWEIIKRKDLNINNLAKPESINSISRKGLENENLVIQIDQKDIDSGSLDSSKVEIMKNLDLNFMPA